MAYNAGFPMNYSYYPYQLQPQPQPQVQSQQSLQQPVQNSIIWVQGEAGAKSYLVAPNTTVPLWDSEAQSIYLKSADVSGMPSMKILDYTIRNSESSSKTPINTEAINYATKEEMADLRTEVMQKIDSIKGELGA